MCLVRVSYMSFYRTEMNDREIEEKKRKEIRAGLRGFTVQGHLRRILRTWNSEPEVFPGEN